MESELIRYTKNKRKKISVSKGCPSVGTQSGKPDIVSIHFDRFNVADLTIDDAEWLIKTLESYTKDKN